MSASLTWLDLTASDRDKMRRVLDLFSESGTVDELGLGTLRDALSDALFPGTSSIQTRLRYMLFIPWIYRDLERRRVKLGEVRERARKGELSLIGPLMASGDTAGVIGSTARGNLKRLPSEAYWSGLITWGLFLPAKPQGWYQRHFDAFTRGRPSGALPDDPGVVWSAQRSWNPRLPEPPDGFPREVSLALTSEEAEFLRSQIETRCPGTVLQWLATQGVDSRGAFWDEPSLANAPDSVRTVTELARRFSLHVEGAPLLYNRMLAQARFDLNGDEGDEALMVSYDERLAEWATREGAEDGFEPGAMWAFAAERGARVSVGQRAFLEAWCRRVAAVGGEGLAKDEAARQLIRGRERRLKTARSRLDNQGRLLAWSGSVGVGRMDFRWFRVRQMLLDLHAGLGGGHARA